LKELFEKITSPGDIAASALGSAVGYGVGLFLLFQGILPASIGPAEIAIFGFLLFWAIKRLMQLIFSRDRSKKKLELQTKAQTLISYVDDFIDTKPRQLEDAYERFQSSHYLWTGGIITDDEFKDAVLSFEETCKQHAKLLTS